MSSEIFKAYDIRGIYGEELDEKLAYKIGNAIVRELSAKKLAVGRDARPHGESLMKSLIEGINDAGCDVVELGMITTPMLWYSSWNLDVDGAVSVTASHNPIEYNGVKICRKNAVPVGLDSGLANIRDIALDGDMEIAKNRGNITRVDLKEEYFDFVASFANFGNKKFNVVIDCANTMGVLDLEIYKKLSDNISYSQLYCDLSNPYSAHEANPLNVDTLTELRQKVVDENADLGIAYDGDADRIGFIDETGEVIPMDLITGLVAKILLKDNAGSVVLYDLRSSMSVKEVIEENGGIAHECRVGHAYIKLQMSEENALFAGELSGHYYYKVNKNGELSTFTAITLLNLMAKTGKKISELVKELRRYYHSGEINSKVDDADKIIKKLKDKYSDGKISNLDGLKISYWNINPKGSRWWFNVRLSNTEPVMRLNLEADSKEFMEAKKNELLDIIKNS